MKQCSEAIRIREDEEPRLYCDRAEAYLDEDMYDEVNSFSSVDQHLVRFSRAELETRNSRQFSRSKLEF